MERLKTSYVSIRNGSTESFNGKFTAKIDFPIGYLLKTKIHSLKITQKCLFLKNDQQQRIRRKILNKSWLAL